MLGKKFDIGIEIINRMKPNFKLLRYKKKRNKKNKAVMEQINMV